MIKKLNNFKKFFPIDLKYSKKNKAVLLTDRIQNDANLRTFLFGYNLNIKHNYNLYLVSDVSNRENIPIYNNLDIKNFSISFKFKYFKYFFLLLASLFDVLAFYLKTLFVNNKIDWLINNFKCKKVKIGDLVYDSYVRYDFKFINPTIYEIKFFIILTQGILRLNFIDYLVKKYSINAIVASQMSFSSYGNLAQRYGTKYKLKTFNTSYNFIIKYNNHKETLTSPFKINKEALKKITIQIPSKKIEKFYSLRKSGKLYGNYVSFNTLRKTNGISKDLKVLKFINKINKIKKKHQINLFALHCFSDSPHFCGDMIFRDFYDYFLQTLNFIRNNDKDNFWIIKPHPARAEYHEIGIVEKELNKHKSDLKNVVICPEKINNYKLYELSDNLVNCVSTISLEFACEGKRSIVAGDAPYFHEDLFFKPKNKNEYFNLIKNLNKFKIHLNKQQVFLAKKILYFVEKQSNFNLAKSKILPDIVLNNYDEKSYLKNLELNINMKKKNFSILKDPLYKSIDLKLSNINF